MERNLLSASPERGRTPAEQFTWFLNVCLKGVDTNGTIVVFRAGEDHQLIRQSFAEIGDGYCDDISIKANVVKRAAEAFLASRGAGNIEVVINDRESAQTNGCKPVLYKEVAFKRLSAY